MELVQTGPKVIGNDAVLELGYREMYSRRFTSMYTLINCPIAQPPPLRAVAKKRQGGRKNS